MAKWGEGDPRWIVEERPDAINVNNWHWTEKNACGWSKEKFKELFNDYVIENDLFKCKISEIEKCEGEASANNRKGKLIFFFEWEITLKFKGKLINGDKNVTGKVVLPNISEENDACEVDVNVSVEENTVDADVVKECMREYGAEKIREQVGKYIQSLKAEFSQGMILPKKDSEDAKSKDSINSLAAGLESKVQMGNAGSNKESEEGKSSNKAGNKLNTTTLECTIDFQCTGPELYNALTITEMVIAFTHGPVTLDLNKGGKFELFGGNIHGEFIEIVPNSKIVQTWRNKRWPSGHFSTVTMEIFQRSDHTELKLTQSGVPTTEAESTQENWEKYYWESIKRSFGYGYFI